MTTAILPPSREAMIGSQKGGGKKKRASSAKADSDSNINQILDSKLPLSYESNIQRRFAPTLVTKDRNHWSLSPKSASSYTFDLPLAGLLGPGRGKNLISRFQAQPGSGTLYELFNFITHAAQSHKPWFRMRLEAYAGEILMRDGSTTRSTPQNEGALADLMLADLP
jgi:hypothetical protein